MSAPEGLTDGCYPVRWADHGRQAIAVLPEHVDLSTADLIREQLLTLINRGAKSLIADMTATISCDHAGVDALARVYQRAAASGAELRLVVTAPVVRRLLRIRDLDRLVSIYPVLEAALAASRTAVVLPLAPRQTRSAMTVTPGGARGGTALDPDVTAMAAQQRQLREALDKITHRIFEVALTLNTTAGLPPGELRDQITEASRLLNEIVGDIYDAMLQDCRR